MLSPTPCEISPSRLPNRLPKRSSGKLQFSVSVKIHGFGVDVFFEFAPPRAFFFRTHRIHHNCLFLYILFVRILSSLTTNLWVIESPAGRLRCSDIAVAPRSAGRSDNHGTHGKWKMTIPELAVVGPHCSAFSMPSLVRSSARWNLALPARPAYCAWLAAGLTGRRHYRKVIPVRWTASEESLKARPVRQAGR